MLLAAFYQQRKIDERPGGLAGAADDLLRHESIQSERRIGASADAATGAVLARGDIKNPGALAQAGRTSVRCRACRANLHVADPTMKVRGASRWPIGWPIRRMCSPGGRSPTACGSITSARVWSIRRTTSDAWARRRRIRSCSIGWPRRCAITAAR